MAGLFVQSKNRLQRGLALEHGQGLCPQVGFGAQQGLHRKVRNKDAGESSHQSSVVGLQSSEKSCQLSACSAGVPPSVARVSPSQSGKPRQSAMLLWRTT